MDVSGRAARGRGAAGSPARAAGTLGGAQAVLGWEVSSPKKIPDSCSVTAPTATCFLLLAV